MEMSQVTTKVFQIVTNPINCHAWSSDGKRLAVCPNDETVQIYIKEKDSWKLEETLFGHDQIITAMDWHSDNKGDRLLTVSADRNGYVWTRLAPQSNWRQTLVLLRLRRAATCVKWSKDGSKFAVGGSEGVASVGYYEAENDWWVCKHLKNLDGSPLLSLTWHPCGKLLAVSTLSGRVEILSTALKNIDKDDITTGPSWIEDASVLSSFDQSIGSLEYGCWIHSLTFSPSGDRLAMAAHDGNVYIMDFSQGQQASVGNPSNGLPLRRLVFVTENGIVASGFGNSSPFLIVGDKCGGGWTVDSDLQSMSKQSRQSSTTANSQTSQAFGGALAKFKALDSQGISINTSEKSVLPTTESIHQSGISDLRVLGGSNLTSTGHDGRLVLWDLSIVLSRIGIKSM